MRRGVCSSAALVLLVLGGSYACADDPTGVPVDPDVQYEAITAGSDHVCALTEDGRAACWGSNGSGQLGFGGSGYVEQPRYVDTDLVFVAIDAGVDHTCGVTTDGIVYCWGGNGFGQLGPGEVGGGGPDVRRVDGLPAISDVSAGGWFSCAVGRDGSAACWGRNHVGQTGRGVESDVAGPARVAGAERWASLSAGVAHACGVTTDATLRCWGEGRAGRLGQGSTASSSRPVGVLSAGRWRAVSAGLDHTCALVLDGTGYCWGSNRGGGLGGATKRDQTSPSRLEGTFRFTGIHAAMGTWGCGVTTETSVVCWGTRDVSQAFDADLPPRLPLPTKLSPGPVIGLAAGRVARCVLSSEEQPDCRPSI